MKDFLDRRVKELEADALVTAQTINGLEAEAVTLNADIVAKATTIDTHQHTIESLTSSLKAKNYTISTQQVQLWESGASLADKKSLLASATASAARVARDAAEWRRRSEAQTEREVVANATHSAEAQKLRHRINFLEHDASVRAEQALLTTVVVSVVSVVLFGLSLRAKDAAITQLRTDVATKDTAITQLRTDVATRDAAVARNDSVIAQLRGEEMHVHPVVASCIPYCRLHRNSDQCATEEGTIALQAERSAVAAMLTIVTGQGCKWCGPAGVEAARTAVGAEEAAAVLLRSREREHAHAAAARDAEPSDQNHGRAAATQAVLQDARASHKVAVQEAAEARSLFPGLTAYVGRSLEDAKETARAAAAGDAPLLERLIKRNPEVVSWPDESGFPPLHAAARAGHQACVRLLLAYGADPHAVSADGNLAVAVAAEYPAVVKVLGRAMADVPRRRRSGQEESVAPSSTVAPPTNVPADHCRTDGLHEPYFAGAVAAGSHLRAAGEHDPLTRGLHSLYDTTDYESPAPSDWQRAIPSNHTDAENADVVLVSLSTE